LGIRNLSPTDFVRSWYFSCIHAGHAVFSKNRDRLLSSAVAQQFFSEVNRQAKRFMSDEHFTVDGTLIQAWASQKSFRAALLLLHEQQKQRSRRITVGADKAGFCDHGAGAEGHAACYEEREGPP
jgi:hypothetical protein